MALTESVRNDDNAKGDDEHGTVVNPGLQGLGGALFRDTVREGDVEGIEGSR